VTASGTPTPSGSTVAPGSASSDTPSAGPSSGVPVAQDAEPTAAAGHSSGSVLPLVITVVVVALLGSVVAVRVRQRRRSG
jgi:hypothetical protein